MQKNPEPRAPTPTVTSQKNDYAGMAALSLSRELQGDVKGAARAATAQANHERRKAEGQALRRSGR